MREERVRETHNIGGVEVHFNDANNQRELIDGMYSSARRRANEQHDHITRYRLEGAKVIGWDDGWHDRTVGAEKFTGVYPLYADNAQVGDKLLLVDWGWRKPLWYTITEIEVSRWGTATITYHIDPVKPAKKPSLWTKFRKQMGF